MNNVSSSAERDPLENFYSNITNRTFECEELRKENKELRKKLKKTRKEKKRWKKKYLELYNYTKMMEDTIFVSPPIKPLNEDALKPTNPIKSRVKPGSMDWLYEV